MKDLIPHEKIEHLIYTLRGYKVMLDSDLAKLYGVEIRSLIQAAKRNIERFPSDFMFQLSAEENLALRSQIVILKTGRGKHRKYLPYAFTEHGAIMAANMLNSPRAAQMSVFVVRAFVRMRSLMTERHELARRLADMEKKLTRRLNVHEAAIVNVLRRVITLLEPLPIFSVSKRRRIGFGAKR